MAAAKSQAGKSAKTVHTVFARGGQASEPVDIRGGTMHGPDLRQRGGDQGRRQSYRLLLYMYISEQRGIPVGNDVYGGDRPDDVDACIGPHSNGRRSIISGLPAIPAYAVRSSKVGLPISHGQIIRADVYVTTGDRRSITADSSLLLHRGVPPCGRLRSAGPEYPL